jgi:hypothetical protein
MKALPVKLEVGRWILTRSKPLIWEAVRLGATAIDDLGPLSGWGQWGHAYQVHYGDGSDAIFFTEREALLRRQ